MKRAIALTVVATMVAGCASVETSYTPIVDMKDVDRNAFAKDLGECRQYAVQTLNAEQGAAAGAVAGAVLGLAIGAMFGVRGRDLSAVAGTGALTGGLSGAGSQHRSQTDIVKNCMSGRGYRVLG